MTNPAVVGERGAWLARMCRLGLPVPGGFTLTTDAWRAWRRNGEQMPFELRRELARGVNRLARDALAERDAGQPVLLAIRHSPPVRSANVRGTILGIGLDRSNLQAVIESLWRPSGSERADSVMGGPGASPELGTALIVQQMIRSGSEGPSGAGRLITRDPVTGLPGAVGSFTPASAPGRAAGPPTGDSLARLRISAPDAYVSLAEGAVLLESAYRDICEIEFLLGGGKIWMIDARPAERSGAAAMRAAVDFVDGGLIDVEEAIARIPLQAMDRLQRAVIAGGETVSAPHVVRLFSWVEEAQAVPVLERPPPGWPVILDGRDAARLAGASAIIELDGVTARSSGALRATVRAALARGAGELALRLSGRPIEADLEMPAGPWSSIVAPREQSWAAGLLAARVRVEGHGDRAPAPLEQPTMG